MEDASALAFLEDHSENIYDTFIIGNRPIVVGGDYLKRAHKNIRARQCVWELKQFTIDYKDKIMDVLTDAVVGKINLTAIEEINKSIEARIKDLEDFNSIFKELDNQFNSLNNVDKNKIIIQSITLLLGIIKGIRLDMGYQMTHVEDIKPNFIIDQIFAIIEGILTTFLTSFKKGHFPLDRLKAVPILLLRLEAVKRGKLAIEELDDDIATCSELLDIPILYYNDSIFEILSK